MKDDRKHSGATETENIRNAAKEDAFEKILKFSSEKALLVTS
jgi:hypothetical protein